MTKKTNSSGNVLFFIIIAVGLFAALAFVITSSTRNNAAPGPERLEIHATKLVDYASLMRQSVQRIKLINGCEDEEISFYMPSIAQLSNFQHTPEARDACKVFHPDGGGVYFNNFKKDPAIAADTSGYPSTLPLWLNGEHTVVGIGNNTEANLMVFIPNIQRSLCLAINNILDIENVGESPPREETALQGSSFRGTYQHFSTFPLRIGLNSGNAVNSLVNQSMGCFEATNTQPYYVFYATLIERDF